MKTKVVKQKLKKIFQHVFNVEKHVELKFLKFIKHVKIILQILINQNNMFIKILIKLKQHVYKNNLFFQHVF